MSTVESLPTQSMQPPEKNSDAITEEAYDAGTLFWGRGVSEIASVFIGVLLTYLFSATIVGQIGEIIVYYGLISAIATTGVPNALSFFVPGREPGARRAVCVTAIGLLRRIAVSLSVVLLAVGAAAFIWDWNSRWLYLGLLGFFPIGDLPMKVLPNLLVIEKRSLAATLFSILLTFAPLVAIALPAYIWSDLRYSIVALNALGLTYLTVPGWVLRRVYPGESNQETPVTRAEMFRYSLPLGVTEMSANLNRYVDQILITVFFASAAALAYYRAGSIQIPLIPALTYAVGVAYPPKMARLFQEGKTRQIAEMWRGQTKKSALITIGLSAFVALCAEEIVAYLYPEDYSSASLVLRCYALMTLGRVTAYGSILVATGKSNFLARAAVFTLISNVVLSVPLTYFYGFAGPPIGTAVSYFFTILIYLFYNSRALSLPYRSLFPLLTCLKIGGVALLAGIPILGAKLGTLPEFSLFQNAALFLALYLIGINLTRLMNSEDWKFLGYFASFKWLSKRSRRQV